MCGKLGAEQFPISSTGRDKCNTTQIESIATSPNLHRKGSHLMEWFQFYDQFCMDLHSSTTKSWKQTSKTNQRPICTRNHGSLSEKKRVSRSTLSAHTAVDFHKTTCTISTLILLKPVCTLWWLTTMQEGTVANKRIQMEAQNTISFA